MTVQTPLLENPLTGSVYAAKQRQNKFGSLLAVYVAVQDPATGVLVKIPGKVEANASNGNLVASFPEAPQLPFSSLNVHLDGGPLAVLVKPSRCGTYSTDATLTPWSVPAPVATGDSSSWTPGRTARPVPRAPSRRSWKRAPPGFRANFDSAPSN